MSFFPNEGTILRLEDGRIAAMAWVRGTSGRIVFADGHEEPVAHTEEHPNRISELLTDEDLVSSNALEALLTYLEKHAD